MKNILSKIAEVRFFRSITELWSNKSIRTKILFTIGMVLVYRFIANIPPAGIDQKVFVDVFKDNPLTNIFTVATGGRLDNPSLVMIGLGAYINASIILQLLSTVIPKLEELTKEGATGRKIIGQYTRYLTIPLSILQAFVIYVILRGDSRAAGLVPAEINLDVVVFVASIAAGSLVLMWIGELISENGVGNGSSIIISLSILSSLPALAQSDFSTLSNVVGAFLDGNLDFVELLKTPDFTLFLILIIGMIVLVAIVVQFSEGTRKIPIQHARRVATRQDNYLPIKLNQSGVMPIIFASAILTFPTIIVQLVSSVSDPNNTSIQDFVKKFDGFFINDPSSIGYNLTFFFLIIAFSYFYIFVLSKPSETADNLKKSGAYIPGIRPGKATENYITQVIIKLTGVGSVVLALMAILPSFVQYGYASSASLGLISGIGSTSMLIIVSVMLTTYRQLQAMKVTKSYDMYR